MKVNSPVVTSKVSDAPGWSGAAPSQLDPRRTHKRSAFGHAWAAVRIKFMPAGNAALAAAGLTCFFISDMLVGVHFSTQPGAMQAFCIYLTWIFYTPGLVLPALSGYKLSWLNDGSRWTFHRY